ncbi:MAG: SCO family protein [Anaerolineales bacterium]|nr:SCO family protein [Chloroflexota bacterium]MBL6982631.1 SCO family protein [Anaerolineales bacterium]
MKKGLLYTLYFLIGLLVIAALAFKIFQPVQVVPRIRLSPGFSLIDQDGERLTNEDVRGQFVLYNFSYTRCPDPCGNMNQTLAEIQSRLNEINLGDIEMKFVTISFDPKHDSPETMKDLADYLGADPAQWKFATTPDETLLKAIIGGGFEAYYNLNEDGSFTFDPKFVLVDGWGIIRGEYRYQTQVPDTERILRHIGVLAKEVHNSQGSASLAYEAAHYFLCYTP